MVIKLDERKIFTGWTTPKPWPENVRQMLMHDLFAVDNLLVTISSHSS